jgi:hypothetical protein
MTFAIPAPESQGRQTKQHSLQGNISINAE